MTVRPILLSAMLLTGCASAPRGTDPDLVAQLRAIREEQARQSHQLDVLTNRVTLAEDTARDARAAVLGARGTVTIPEDLPASAPPAERVSPAVVATPRADDDSPTSSTPRPSIRITGRESPAGFTGAPITVRPSDRLPVVPVPNIPEGIRPSGAEIAPPPSASPPSSNTASPGPSGSLDPAALPTYDAALALARGGRCREAVEQFAAFLTRFPDHPYADHAMYWRGECILSQGDARAAASEFEGLIARFPTGQKVADALYKLVGVYRRLGDAMRAEQYATRLLHDFPRSESAARLRSERNS